MRIFLTGATGFIGSHLAEALVGKKHQVSILIRTSSNTWRIEQLLSKVHIIKESGLERYFSVERPDVVFHLATHYVKSHQSQDVAKMIDSNIRLPSIILQLARQFGTKKFINIGTCFEYPQSTKKISELDSLEAYNLYASTKIAFEKILEFYAKQPEFRAVTLRLFYPYGEKDNQKVIPLMISSLLKNQQMVISKGEQKLDYTYVGDIVEACLKTLTFIVSPKYLEYEVFNIGEGKGKQLKRIATVLNQIHGKELILCEKEYPENDIMNMIANVQKAKKMLNWQTKTPLEVGLKKTYKYYQIYEKQYTKPSN